MVRNMFGDLFKKHRIAQGKTLRAFCLEFGYDAGNISRLERGKMAPPDTDEAINRYADNLGLKSGSAERQEFIDVAYAERGKVPTDLMSDADLVDKLPVLFRSLRTNGCDDDLRKLAEEIRKL